MDITVLGAGVIGVTTAWFLNQNGHNVRVIDQADGPGREATLANGGQLSANAAEPWANPSTLRTALSWLFKDNMPLVFKPKPNTDQWRWLLTFLFECRQQRYVSNLVHLANLGTYSRQALDELRAELQLTYNDKQNGILLFFTDAEKHQKASEAATRLASYGFKREALTAEECLAIEPALQSLGSQLQGGIYSRHDQTGDSYQFTEHLANKAASQGVTFEYNTKITGFETSGNTIKHVQLEDQQGTRKTFNSDHYVLCLGAASARIAKQLGIRLNIYPVKGYSITVPIVDNALMINRGLNDTENRIAFSRLGNSLRAAATAEISNYDLTIDEDRCKRMVARAVDLFPEALDASQAQYWAGLRPMTPSNLPYIGQMQRYRNLFVNTGHGTLGWTQACGSAKALASIVDGKSPNCDFPFLGI